MDKAYEDLLSKVNRIECESDQYKDSFVRYPQEEHLDNIKNSGYFSYASEIVFMNSECCDAERYFNIAISQGGLQAILKKEPQLIKSDLEQFKTEVYDDFKGKWKEIEFC